MEVFDEGLGFLEACWVVPPSVSAGQEWMEGWARSLPNALWTLNLCLRLCHMSPLLHKGWNLELILHIRGWQWKVTASEWRFCLEGLWYLLWLLSCATVAGTWPLTPLFINEYLWSCCNKTLLSGTEIHISYDFPSHEIFFFFDFPPIQ